MIENPANPRWPPLKTDKRTPIAIDWDRIDRVDGWPLKPVIAWLTAEGRFAGGMGDLARGLGDLLHTGGAPIARLRFASFTLHPLVRAWTGTWHIRDGAKQADFTQAPAYLGSPIQIMNETGRPYRRRMDGPLEPDAHDILKELKATGVTDYFMMPMPGRDAPTGYISFSAEHEAGFDDTDVAKFETLTPFIAQVVETINRARVAATLLDTYVGRRAGQRVLAGHIHRGDSEKIRAAIWYSDLRDFTRLSEELAPEEMTELLNAHFGILGDAIITRGGEVLQFIGDAALGIFECTTDAADQRRACTAAFDAATEALAKTALLNAVRAERNQPPIRFGIGLHIGDVTFGNVGAETRLGFNVVGPAVNLTARLESLSKETGTPLLISAALAAALGRELRPVGAFALKGVHEVQQVFTAAE